MFCGWEEGGDLQEEPRRAYGEEGASVFPVGEVDVEIVELLFQASLVFSHEPGRGGDVFFVGLAFFHDESGVEGRDEWD